MQEDWQNTGVVEMYFGTKGYARTPNISIKSHHAFAGDRGSSFYFRFTVASTMDQGAKVWEQIHYFRFVAFNIVTWLPEDEGSWSSAS